MEDNAELIADVLADVKQKIVINVCYGGFGLSDEAVEWLIENKNWTVYDGYDDPNRDYSVTTSVTDTKKEDYSFMNKYSLSKDYEPEFRSHPDVIEVVETLGAKANDRYSQLKIVEVPPNVAWTIQEYDGNEYVAEVHRTWSLEE